MANIHMKGLELRHAKTCLGSSFKGGGVLSPHKSCFGIGIQPNGSSQHEGTTPTPPPPRTSIGTLLLVWQLKVKWAGFSLTWLIYWVQYIVFVVYIQWPQSSFPQNQLEHECYTYSNMVHSIDVLLLLGMANCLSSNFREGVRFAHHDQSWNEAKTDHPWH